MNNAPIPGDNLRNLAVQLAIALGPVLLPNDPNDKVRLGVLAHQLTDRFGSLLVEFATQPHITLVGVVVAIETLHAELAAAYGVDVAPLLTLKATADTSWFLLRVLRCGAVLGDEPFRALREELGRTAWRVTELSNN